MSPVLVQYAAVRDQIQEADVLIVRGRGLVSRAIGVAGRSEASHAGVIGRAYGRLFVMQQTGIGQKRPLLSEVVRACPGRVDLYRIWQDLAWEETRKICQTAMDLASQRYGWGDICRVACYHLPVVRWFTDRRGCEAEDAPNRRRPLFCAGLVSASYRSAGHDLVPNLPDWRTEPGDLVRSSSLHYTFTLTQ